MMHKRSDGFILSTLLFTTLFISFVVIFASSLAISYSNTANRETYKINAQMAADAGIDQALALLNTRGASAFTGGELSEAELLVTEKYRTTYTKSILDGASEDEKTLIVIGRTYAPVTAARPTIERRYKVDVKAVTSGNSPASVVSGVGGLILNNNSKITGGDVIVNGTITVNTNAQIGLSTNPLNVRAAHQSCPTSFNSAYPSVCAPGESGQPIVANGVIYGNVQAQNQTSGNNMFNPGLTADYAQPVTIPIYNRVAHKNSVSQTYQSNSEAIKCVQNQANWSANIKIIGDVSLPNNCTVTINGDVWVTGKLTTGNGSIIKVNDSVTDKRPVIMIDSKEGLSFSNNSRILLNSLGTGVEFITTWWNTDTNTNGGFNCGGLADPLDCTNVVGLALYTSQNVKTIEYNNNATAPNSILRSMWSKTFIANNGQLGAVSGQTIELGNNAIINFSTYVPGSKNLIVTWAKRGYIRVY